VRGPHVGDVGLLHEEVRQILAGLRALDPEGREATILYGTTIATNAIIERKGAPTALLAEVKGGPGRRVEKRPLRRRSPFSRAGRR